MDQISLGNTGEKNVSSPHIFLLLLLLFLILKYINSIFSERKHFPPGPKAWPIIGNLHQIGKKPHISMAKIAKDHGPLISLRLGSQLLVVGSSPVAATEILKTQDRLLSGRYLPKVNPYDGTVTERISFVWAPSCTDNWRYLRGLCRTELFSPKAIESQASLREDKVGEMVEFLATKEGKVVDIGEIVFTTVFNTLSNVFFSKDFIGLEDEGLAGGLKAQMGKMMELGTTPNIADFYPILEGLDPQRLRKKTKKIVGDMFAVWEPIIKERRRRQKHGHDIIPSKHQDFLDIFLANNFSDERINSFILELFTAGIDTTTTTVEWAMAELLKNRQVMDKVDDELRREINDENLLKESRVCQLPFLSATIKETLRLHPPAPFLLPHRAQETCEVLNYTIPKDTEVLVNVWAIGRDPAIWVEDPLSFKPERFLGSNLELKSHDYEFLAFGAGRRSCPGLPLAARQLHLILASLIRCFEWHLPNGDDPATLDMDEKFGVTLQKEHPLLILPQKKKIVIN